MSEKEINGSEVTIPEAATPSENRPVEGQPTAFNIGMQPMQTPYGKMIRISLVFQLPEQLRGQEYASFMLNHHDAGVFARKLEKARKVIA